MNSELKRIPSLDGLRGLAITLVLLGHGLGSLEMPHLNPYAKAVMAIAGNGSLGVGIFFALSGFLIYSLSRRELEETGKFSWRQFYVRRMYRIFPAFYFFLIVVSILYLGGWLAISWQMLLSAATFSLNYRHLWDHSIGTDYSVIGHYWTLALEEQFYLTWPLLMLLLARKRLLPLLVFIIAIAPFVRVACYFFTPGSQGQIGMMFHTSFDGIAAGVLLGELLGMEKSRRWLLTAASSRTLVLCTTSFLFFVSPLLDQRFGGLYELPIGKSADIVAISILIVASLSFSNGILFRVFNWRPLVYVGVLSYSLYVWNNIFLLWRGHWFNVFPYNFACVVIMGILSHYLVEKPFLKIKNKFRKVTVI